mgnify:CR=1 FL=1
MQRQDYDLQRFKNAQERYVRLLWPAGAAGGKSVYGRSVAAGTSARDHNV